MGDVADKLSYFQAITGLEDIDLCKEILSAHGWDLEQAISSFTSSNSDDNNPPTTSSVASATDMSDDAIERYERLATVNNGGAGQPGLAWKIITLPISIISGSLGLVSGAIGLGLWLAGGVLSYSLGMIGFNNSGRNESSSSAPLVSAMAAASEAIHFVSMFEREYGHTHPNFVPDSFMDALQRSRREFKLMFVYLHSPDHPDTPSFCEQTLCSDLLSSFINSSFVAWGGSIRASEGFKMSNSLKASRFPFCAVVMAATNQRIALIQQVEGPRSVEEMVTMLQRVLEESSPVLTSARLDAEERINNIRLREEQDAAFQAALQADQAREREKREEEERVEREIAEAERREKVEKEERERAEYEAAEREAELVKLRKAKGLALGVEPEKGPDVTQVLVRLPNGERKGRRFDCSAKVQCLYDFIDSCTDSLQIGNYTLATNFPRVLYGPEKVSLTLKEAGLHPQVSLFVEVNS